MITGRAALRLECLKLAVTRQGANDPRKVLEIADEYVGWCLNEAPPATKEDGSPDNPGSSPGPG
jgi:hypothetical protein